MSDDAKNKDSQRLIAGLFANTADLMVIVNLDGIALYVNESFCRLSGYSLPEIIGHNITEFTFAEDIKNVEKILKTMNEGQNILFVEVRLACKDGSIKYISWTGTTNLSESLLYGVGRDVSLVREQEKLQKEFISIASHEIRAPLTAIKSSLELISDGIAGDLPEHAMSLIRMSNDSCDHLLRVVNNILDMDKIENGKMVLNSEPVLLYDAVKKSVDANIHYGQSCGAIFSLKKPSADYIVTMDTDRIIQVMDNLLSNAAKYGSGADIVEINIEKQDKGMVRVSVKDHGEGIDKSLESHLFQKFIQGRQPTRSREGAKLHGTGLGLSICKSLIELNGGKIGFFSHKGKGTTFYFDLPLLGSADIHPAPEPEIAEPAKKTAPADDKYRILICEDEPLVLHVLEQMLKKNDFLVESADSPKEARKRLSEKHFDAMTVDLMMPNESGAEFVKKIKADKNYQNLPIIVISGVASVLADSSEGKALGAFDFLDKPIDRNRFNETLQRLKTTIKNTTMSA